MREGASRERAVNVQGGRRYRNGEEKQETQQVHVEYKIAELGRPIYEVRQRAAESTDALERIVRKRQRQ
jgi:hypothetical protein